MKGKDTLELITIIAMLNKNEQNDWGDLGTCTANSQKKKVTKKSYNINLFSREENVIAMTFKERDSLSWFILEKVI